MGLQILILLSTSVDLNVTKCRAHKNHFDTTGNAKGVVKLRGPRPNLLKICLSGLASP